MWNLKKPSNIKQTFGKLFVLKPQKENPLVACLAKDFYPKDLEIYMNSTKNSFSHGKVSAKLSSKGKYSTALVTNLGTNNAQCHAKHQGKWVTNTETTSKLKDLNYQPKEIDLPDSGKCQQDSERSSTLSLYVIGIRLLFTKAVAFNIIVTAKFLAL
ncbi:hypothetical protein GDO81_001852 [Engystomops pustulosus]|uniref:Uncharacterized protein n=1 Tax=Engystomops pustulosus TaxID=76066 RepID=A0AAV7DI99_ENGPU|nr:hypothetical protein GDO81_001852 [Engystomops pustulosus]